MTTTTIITVRHATTDYNRRRIIAGRIDIPISDEGIKQAISLRTFVGSLEYDAVIASPQKRALQSAELSTEWPRDKLDVREECVERDYGAMQGLTPDEINAKLEGIEYIRVGKFYHSLNPPGGESFETVRARAVAFKHYLLKRYRDTRALVFSHHTFLQQFHGAMLDMDTHACLNLDIRPLEFNFFDLDKQNRLVDHSVTRPVGDGHESW